MDTCVNEVLELENSGLDKEQESTFVVCHPKTEVFTSVCLTLLRTVEAIRTWIGQTEEDLYIPVLV